MPEPTPRLADHTTLRLGGPARAWVTASTEEELVGAVRAAEADGVPLLLLAGGSNLVVADEGFAGTVVHIRTVGIEVLAHDETVRVRVAAGESWDGLVAHAVDHGWVGIEALSGIPGAVGSTPIQNVGAYGQEVSQTITSVRVWDRRAAEQRTIAAAECDFGYRHSRFKSDPLGFVVLSVDFEFALGEQGAPVAYAELARTLGVEQGQSAPLAAVREAVLGLRRGKGMVLDPVDHDTWSAGSFFTNPVLSPAEADRLPADAPRFPTPDGRVKTSAAWLIDHAGFTKGFGNERVSLSTKHALALTNRGRASTSDLLALAMEVRDGVELAYGVRLVNEPVLVGCRL